MATVKIIPATAQEAKVLRVAAYCRVSSDSADQLHSYASQIRSYTEMIENHPDWKLVDVYADGGLTGTRMDKREEFNRLIADCRKGLIDKIIVKSISRFARNTKDCLVVLRELKLLDVSVQFEEDHIDTETLTSEMMVSVFGSLAQQESISISQNQQMSYQRRMQSGQFITCSSPYGYRIIQKKYLEIVPEEAEVVRWIFEAYLQGDSMEEIVSKLNAQSIPSPGGSPVWYVHSVHYILLNEKYIGDSLGQKSYTTGFPFQRNINHGEKPKYYASNTHPAIISRDTYERAQRLRSWRDTGGNEKKCYPLSRKIYCGKCGSVFVRKQTKQGVVTWCCSRHNERASACPIGRIQETSICTAFVKAYNKLKRNVEVIIAPALSQMNALWDAVYKDNPKIGSINLELLKLSEQDHRLSKLRSSGMIDDAIYRAKSVSINQEMERLKKQKNLLRMDNPIDHALETLTNLYDLIDSGPAHLQTFDVVLFHDLMERITVTDHTEIIFWLHGGIQLKEILQEISA